MGLRPPLVTFIFLKALSYLWPCSRLSATSPPLLSSADSTFPFLAVSCPLIPSSSLSQPPLSITPSPRLYQAFPMTGYGYRCWGEPDSGGRTRVPLFEALS